jgi:hypothetical protein
MTLKKGILWSQKKMRPQNVKRSGKYQGVMGKLMSNEKIAKALDKPGERKEFYGMLKSVSGGGVYKDELRQFFGDLRSGKLKTRTINAKEIRIIAKEFFPDSAKRYSFKESRSPENTPSPSQNASMFDEIRRGFSSSGGSHKGSNAQQNVFALKHGKANQATQYSPGSSLNYEFAKPGFIKATKAISSNSISDKKDAASPEVVKKKPTKRYIPGSSLDYEFAKPGFQSAENPELKKDAEIKPVAPEDYTKIPGTSSKTAETAEKTNAASPEETKKKPAGNYSPLDDRLKYEYKKTDSSETGNTASALGNKPVNTLAKMAPLMNIVRKKMLADKEGDGSGKKRSFFSSMAATMRNKKG